MVQQSQEKCEVEEERYRSRHRPTRRELVRTAVEWQERFDVRDL
jgi:hypothetical protein